MRSLLMGVLLLVTAAQPTRAADEIDAAKLVGKWVPARAPASFAANFVRTFTKDGKYSFGGELKLEGTYKIEGTKLTIKFNEVPGVPTGVEVYTIKKLTDTDLALTAGKNTEAFKRAK